MSQKGQRQAKPLGPYGITRPTTLSLPVGILEMIDTLVAERRAANVQPSSRSGVLVDLLEGGLALCNRERLELELEPLTYDSSTPGEPTLFDADADAE